MSYTEPFNGDYDHQDLFGIGEELWWADWSEEEALQDSSTGYYRAVRVRVLEIIISLHDVKYKVRCLDDDQEILTYDDQLYSDKGEAEEYALNKLLFALDSVFATAQHSVEFHTKVLCEASALRDDLKQRIEFLCAEQKKRKEIEQ